MPGEVANLARMRLRAAVVVVAGCAAFLGLPDGGAAAVRPFQAWFVQDGALVPAERRAGSVPRAVELLLAGPTAREDFESVILRGDRTLVPPSDAFGPCFERRPTPAATVSGRERGPGFEWVRVAGKSDEECRRPW